MFGFEIIIPSAALSFAIASILIELTPGPNMTYLAIVSVSSGRKNGFATVAGVALGLAIIGIAGAIGATALIQSSDILYQVLRWAGFVFLLYLAFDAWRNTSENKVEAEHDFGRHFTRGLLTNILNPKAATFYVTVLPSFIDQDQPTLQQALFLTAIYVLAATIIHACIVLAAGSLKPFLTNPKSEQIVRRILAGLLAGVAIWFFWGTATNA